MLNYRKLKVTKTGHLLRLSTRPVKQIPVTTINELKSKGNEKFYISLFLFF